VLVVGDEAVLMVEGHTGVGGTEATCAWELLALKEVAGMLKKINLEKRAADRKKGRRKHNFSSRMGERF
jgi:hypothetical protein